MPPTTFALPGRVDRVDGAQLRRHRVDDFIIIHALPAHSLIVKADVAVRLHAARREQPSLRINDLHACGRADHRRDGGDFSVLDQQTAVRKVFSGHGFDMCVLDQQHDLVSPFSAAPIRCFSPVYRVLPTKSKRCFFAGPLDKKGKCCYDKAEH